MREAGDTDIADSRIELPLNGSSEVTHLFWKRAESETERSHQPGELTGSLVEARSERAPWREDPRNLTPERYTASPEMQAEVERCYRTERSLGPNTLLAINRAADGAGRHINCADCARAVASTLDGYPRAADALDADNPRDTFGEDDSVTETWLGRKYCEPRPPYEARADLENELLRAGNGTHVIIAEYFDTESGHCFNAVNRMGRIVYIDGQMARTGEEAMADDYAADAVTWQWVRADAREHS